MPAEPLVTAQDITGTLRGLGVQAGDILVVHSSLSAFGHVAGGTGAVVDACLEAAGAGGTVLMPTFTRYEPGGPATPGNCRLGPAR